MLKYTHFCINLAQNGTNQLFIVGFHPTYPLRQLLISIVENFNKKYKDLLTVNISFEELIPIFEESEDKVLEESYKEACKTTQIMPKIDSFPARAETHIYSKNKNKNNEQFIPVLLGVADIFNMHSALEKMNFVSLNRGYELIKEMFLKFNKQ